METKKDIVKTAYIYARTSTDDGDWARSKAREEGVKAKDIRKKESIQEQIRLCEAKCRELGLTVVGQFVDSGYSGRMYPAGYEVADDSDCEDYFQEHIKRRNKKVRPSFGKLLDADRADFLVVRDLSRVVRPFKDSHVGSKIWQILRKKRIRLFTTEGGEIDLNNFNARMLRDIQMQGEDNAKQMEIQRCKQSLTAKKNNGYLASGVKCFGFVSDENGTPQSVTTIPAELKAVRLIYDKYLGGMKLLAIARFLNDEMKIETKNGNRWTVQQVRKVLLRPCYSGQQYNASNELIASKVFPTGAKATISPSEFDRVLMSFKSRERMTVKSDPHAPGPAIGTQPIDGVCHPFSGLVRCGTCGKHMYVTQVMNLYYNEKIPVYCYHYICKTQLVTKDPKFNPCSEARIKEHYPLKSLEMGITPNGNGLIEALFPLLFGGYIPQYIDRIYATPDLAAKRNHLQYEIDQIKAKEEFTFDQKDSGAIDQFQFEARMKKHRGNRADLAKQLLAVEQTIKGLESSATSIPDRIFSDPKELSRETMRDLAHDTLESIKVFPDKITVEFKRKHPVTGQHYSFDIGRIRTRNSRDLPFWKARINSQSITPETKIGVTYFYQSTKLGLYKKIQVLYHDNNLEVTTVGDNFSIDKKRSRNPKLPMQTSLDRFLIDQFGAPPAYGRTLEINSKVFFGGLIVKPTDPNEALPEMESQSADE